MSFCSLLGFQNRFGLRQRKLKGEQGWKDQTRFVKPDMVPSPKTQLHWESLPYLSTQLVLGRLSVFPQDWVFLLECQVGDGQRGSRGCAWKKESWKRACIKSQKIPQARAHVITNLRKQGDPRELCSQHLKKKKKNCNKMSCRET